MPQSVLSHRFSLTKRAMIGTVAFFFLQGVMVGYGLNWLINAFVPSYTKVRVPWEGNDSGIPLDSTNRLIHELDNPEDGGVAYTSKAAINDDGTINHHAIIYPYPKDDYDIKIKHINGCLAKIVDAGGGCNPWLYDLWIPKESDK